jgi:hypothetical protein
MAFNFAPLLSAACGGAPRRLGRLRRPWARCARLFWGGYQHRKIATISKLLETARKLPRVEAPVSAHRISAARTRFRRPNEQQELGHNFVD